MSNIILRDYQKECIDAIMGQPPGSYLVQLMTGGGKTVIFSHIPRQGRVLVLAHREELIRQAAKYYDCPVGFEIQKETSAGEEVVIASVQSLVRRLGKFSPNAFDIIITDECHHAPSRTYRTIYDYFNPRLHLGFTATVARSDHARLDDIFQRIIFQRDLRWGIQHGYLTDILCKRVNIGFDLSAVHSRMGDYAPGGLDKAMDGTADAIAQAYREHAQGATLIFAVSVRHAEEIASKIPGAVTVTGETKNRAEIIQAFTEGKIPVLVNCMVFTEGTDIPRVETVIIARPTQSESLYAQMVGRGLRLYPGKERLVLIDCVGVSGKASLCTAPSLLGIDVSSIPAARQKDLEGPLFELPEKAAAAADCPESWIKNVEIVDLWAKQNSYNLHNVSFFQLPDGSLKVSLPGSPIRIPAPDALGNVRCKDGSFLPMQDCIDAVYKRLTERHQEQAYIWDAQQVKRWGKAPASEAQLKIIQRRCKGFNTEGLTKGQASMILNRIMNEPRRAR